MRRLVVQIDLTAIDQSIVVAIGKTIGALTTAQASGAGLGGHVVAGTRDAASRAMVGVAAQIHFTAVGKLILIAVGESNLAVAIAFGSRTRYGRYIVGGADAIARATVILVRSNDSLTTTYEASVAVTESGIAIDPTLAVGTGRDTID